MKKHRTLTIKLWSNFVIFAGILMVMLWLFQIIFLNTYYQSMKKNEIERIGNTLVRQYEEDDFETVALRSAFENGMILRLADGSGKTIAVTAWEEMRPMFRNNPYADRHLVTRLKESGRDRLVITEQNERMRATIVSYIAPLEEDLYLILSSPLAPMDATVQVLKNQLAIVTVLALLLATGMAYIIARRLAKPISSVTESAAKLAKGDYKVTFEEGGYAEINSLAQTLNHTTCELAKTEALRQDLIANVSHDLRTPLTIIKSYAEMIRDLSGNNPEKRGMHTNVIIEESNRLSDLVDDMLDLSRMEAGTIRMEPKPFDFSAEVRSTLRRFSLMQEKEGYRFLLSCPEKIMAVGDEKRIDQVLYNLISNAVNYTGEDKTVSILVTEGNGLVRFSVRDTGKGIPPEKMPVVWDRYYRVSESHHRTTHGTGIGLSIVKNILDAHKAEYGINSKVGEGSEFWFLLPLAEEEKND